jgi:hypothetical protein
MLEDFPGSESDATVNGKPEILQEFQEFQLMQSVILTIYVSGVLRIWTL